MTTNNTWSVDELICDQLDAISGPPRRRRARLIVEIDLDPLPGWGHDPEDHRVLLQNHLDNIIGHYHPTVTIDRSEDLEEAAKCLVAEAKAAGQNKVAAVKALRYWHDEQTPIGAGMLGLRDAHDLVSRFW